MKKEIRQSLNDLLDYLDTVGFEGYDPYDALNSPFLLKLGSKWLRVAFTALFRLSPLNLRKFFGTEKGINPKAMGLFLSAYSILRRIGIIESDEKPEEIFKWLYENSASGYSGMCWGYNFPWQTKRRLLEKGIPTVVNTSFIGHGILDYYEISKNKTALEAARSSCDFILNDLNIFRNRHGICFSYSPIEKKVVHNANILGASLLARVYTHTNEGILIDHATQAYEFTVQYQHENGLWAYSMDPETGEERYQTDWHQGFILDSLIRYLQSIEGISDRYEEALRKGASFYKHQFTERGIAFWRHPRKWPIDIHNQAQGIITFSRLEEYIPGSIEVAERILAWTLSNMVNKKKGFFYYEKWPCLTNKISYLRWNQAWLLLGISLFIEKTLKSH